MRIFEEFVITLLSFVLCPLAHIRSAIHQFSSKSTTCIYGYNFRFLMFCKNCHKVFVNELTQDEVDELEAFDFQKDDE